MPAQSQSPFRPRWVFLWAGVLLLGCAALIQGDDTARTSEKTAPLTGIWEGEYQYTQAADLKPVAFTLIMVQDGEKLTGAIKETNTFGEQSSPWLHAMAEGHFDKETREFTFTKTYDGTGGIKHDVIYKGRLSKDGKSTEEGTWNIPGSNQGSFTLRKGANHVNLTGVWAGEYQYPKDGDVKPVAFTLILIQDGKKLTGEIKEPNTFGAQDAPWLHATAEGQIDNGSRDFTFTKTYDGTGGVKHAVLYKGTLSVDGTKVTDGIWKIEGAWQGTFDLQKK
jgi:hypothetical protein